MKYEKKISLVISLCLSLTLYAQEKLQKWDLRSCIDYAISNNIQIKKKQVALQSSKEDVKLAKSQYLPSLSFSTSQTFSNRAAAKNALNTGNYASSGNYTGNYGLNASWTVFNGGERYYNVKQTNLMNTIETLAVDEAEDDVELQITQAYLQLLYAYESVKISENTVTVSLAQRDRSKQLLEAGSISKADFAQMEAQYASDKYQLVEANATLEETKLTLKQLLELDINEEINLDYPDLDAQDVLKVLPSKFDVYQTALQTLPQVKSQQLNIDVAKVENKKANAGYMPTISMSASVNTGNASASNNAFFTQINDNFNQNVGVTLSLPIFDRRQTKTSIRKAKLQIEDNTLALLDVQKDLLKIIESVYLDAISAQNKYTVAVEKLKSVETSNALVSEQYDLGMKNTLELLTEKNNLLSAQQEVIQSKYMAILNIQLLNFYQNKPIQLD